MDSSNESLDLQEPSRTLSAETVLAVRRYNQQVASYTLRQWNVAKLESERKERDRRKRRADYLVEQQQQQSANAIPAVRPPGSLTSAGVHARPSSEGPLPNPDGPLMMVSKRRTDRALSGGGSVPPVRPVQPITRHSHDQRYASRVDQPEKSYDIHADIASAVAQRQQHQPQPQQRPRRHQRSSHGSYAAEFTALHPISPISAASTVTDPLGKPEAKYVESVVTGIASGTSSTLDNRPLTPPRAWQRRVSASTPPITIPRPSAAVGVPAAAGSASSGGSSAPRSASPARALGFAAHLGMTSISTGPSTSVLADSMSTSTSNPTSEGSSRMSSFSEHNGMPGIRHSLKMVTGENYPRSMDDTVRPRRSHRTSLGATTAQRGLGGPCAVEGAIGTLRRMTVSGDEAGVFGGLDHH